MLSNVTRLKAPEILESEILESEILESEILDTDTSGCGKSEHSIVSRQQAKKAKGVVYKLSKLKAEGSNLGEEKANQASVQTGRKQAVDTPCTTEGETGPRQYNRLIEEIADRQSKPAFAALFKHFAPRVKSFALKGGVDDQVAEEIAQETMLIVWRKAALFDGRKAAASTWIFTIARNKRVDYLRRYNKPALKDHDFIHLETDLKTQDDAYEVEQASVTVREQMDQLPEDQKAVITKAFMEDKSHAVVAKEMGLPLGTVKSRIRIALRKMRGHISDQL